MVTNNLPSKIRAEVIVHRSDGTTEHHLPISFDLMEEDKKAIENHLLLRRALALTRII